MPHRDVPKQCAVRIKYNTIGLQYSPRLVHVKLYYRVVSYTIFISLSGDVSI